MASTGDRASTVSPPAGMGSAPGLGDAFRMNLNTGQGVYSYKISLPDGVAGFSPKLALEYTHGTRLQLFGLGWRLPLRSIDRRLDVGIAEDSQERYLDDSNEIVELTDHSFGALSESAFSRYTRQGDGWKIEERDGTVHQLGTAASARVANPDIPGRVDQWLIEKSFDVSGNTIEYRWNVDGFAYPTEILYAVYAVRFVYEERPDQRAEGRAGYTRRLKKRCTAVELFLDPGPGEKRLRRWAFSYDNSAPNGGSLLTEVQFTSFSTAPDQRPDVVRTPVRFSYNQFDPQNVSVGYYESEAGDPPPLNSPTVALVNLDQAPLPGVLQVIEDRQYYWRNNGTGFSAPEILPPAPFAGSLDRSGVAFMDMTGSGKADLMLLGQGSVQGYYENGGQKGWGRFVAYPRNRKTAPDWSSTQIRVADADGDGVVDAIQSTDRGFILWRNLSEEGWDDPQLSPRGAGENPADVSLANPLVFFADMTGDGLQDLVEIGSGLVQYWPNLGNGRYGDGVVMQHAPRLRDLDSSRDRLLLVDVDGDGCADLVRVTSDEVLIAINRSGISFADPVLLDTVPPPIPGTVRAVNLKGGAASGLLWNSYRSGNRIGYVHLEFSPSLAPYLLAGVDNGAGLHSQLFYGSAVDEYLQDRAEGSIWDTNFPFPLLVVKRTLETDSVTGQRAEVLYRYHDGHYEPHIRRFEGFRTAERLEKGDESRADTKTVFHFLMNMEAQPGNTIDYAALNGSLARIETYGMDGSPQQDLPYSIEESEYEVVLLGDTLSDRKRSFVRVKTHRMRDVERSNDVRGEEKTYLYDDVGNVVRETHRGFGTKGGVAQPEQVRVTNTAYAKSAGRRLLGKHCSVVVRDGAGSNVSETRYFYDGPDFVGLPLGQVDRGLLAREMRLSMSTADFSARFTAGMDGATALGYVDDDDQDGTPSRFINAGRHTYDNRGLKVADLDPMGMESRLGYDPTGLFRTSLTDPLGTTTFDYDRSIGQPIRVKYPDGEVVLFLYDSQGRVVSSTTPAEDPERPARTYIYDDGAVPNVRICRMRALKEDDTNIEVFTYFDGRGNEFQQRAQSDDASFVVSGLRLFNPWGDPKQEFEPVFANDGAFSLAPTAGKPSRSFQYDARGRITQTLNYNGGISRAEYLPFSVTTYDCNDTDNSAANVARGQANTPHREEFDVFRQRSAVIEDLGNGQTMNTRYRNDAQGRALEIADDLGTVSTYTYDLLGHRYQISHRSAGVRKLWYDARGRIVRSLDANGNDLRVNLDVLGRLKSLTSGGVTLEEYTYENGGGANSLGKVSRVTYRGGSQALTYDAGGRVATNEFHFDNAAAPHRIEYEYDYLGRETVQRHSDGTRIEKKLTPNGWVKSVTGVLSDVSYDPRGLPASISFTNGVVTTLGYEDGPGRVNRQKTTGPHGEVYEDITYDFDRMGMLLTSNDIAPSGRGKLGFSYDPLYQVTSCDSTESGAPVSQHYSYFNHLNLSRFDEVKQTFVYDDPLHPDRIAGIMPDAGARQNLNYDANGNLLGLPGKIFSYNEKNELARVTRDDGVTAEYSYDPHGQRISKHVTDTHGLDQRTFFVGTSVEISGGSTAHFVYLAQRRVAIVIGAQTRFVHSDYSGSTSFFTDQNGVKLASIAYRPFGNVARSDGTVDYRTYSIHPFDAESGLYYMRRRYYSPDTGRFLTPDPLALHQPQKMLGNPKALHPYAYVGNDPLNNIDFDGLSFWSVVGAIVGVIVAVALVVAVAAVTIATGGAAGIIIGIVLAIGVVSVSYVVASANRGNGIGEFFRGFMIGFNAGLNAAIATMIFGPVIGVALGVINFLAAFDGIAGNKIYQGILGWSSWLMPMSWLATAVGLVLFVINVIIAGVTFQQWDAAKIDKISIHWETGAIVITGGLIHPMGGSSGFNLGQFAFLSSGSSAEEHETGHGLNVAAFGSIFHFVAALDQNVFGSGADTYSEKLAESHDPSKADPTQWFDMWDPRHA